MSISLDIPRPMSLMFLIAAFMGRRSHGLDSDRDTEVDDPDEETEVDDFTGVDDYEGYEDDEGHDYFSHPPKNPRKWIGFPKLGCAPTSILLLLPLVIIVIGLSSFIYVQWTHAQTQNYLDADGVIQVAQVRVDPTPRYRHHMNVNLLLDDNNGHEYFDPNCSTMCTLSGDNLLLQGEMIAYPSWQGVLGLHRKFKLTIVMGHFTDPAIAKINTPDAKSMNGGDDGYFDMVREQGLLGFLGVTAAYTNTVTVPADSHTYNVYVSQNGLFIKPAD